MAAFIAVTPATADSTRQRTRIDDGWRFALGHATDAVRDFDHGLRPFFFGKAGFGDGPRRTTSRTGPGAVSTSVNSISGGKAWASQPGAACTSKRSRSPSRVAITPR